LIFHPLQQYADTQSKESIVREAQRWLEEKLVPNKRGALRVSRVVEDGSNTTAAPEEADDSLDDPERREDSEDESRDMNEAWRTGVSK
jgi:hypothetical protein